MIRFYKVLISFVLFIPITTGVINAQEATPLSMAACMDYALKHNYNIKNAQIDVLIQKAQNDQTLSASYPHISGKAEVDDFLNTPTSFIDGSSFNFPGQPKVPRGTIEPLSFSIPYTASAGLSGSQLIFDGAVFIAWKARKTVLEFANLNGQVTEEGVRYNVYKTYNSLVIAYRQYDIIKKSLSYARSLQRDLEITRQNGFAEKIEVERTEVQVNNLANDSIRVGNMLTVSEQVLKYQIGMNINTPIILTDTALENRKQNTLALLNEVENYDRVPEYNVVNTSLKLNEFNLQRYRLSALPTLSAFGSMGYNYGHDYLSKLFFFPNYAFNSMVGIQLNVPIYNGRIRHYQMTEAELNVEKSKNNIEFTKQSIDFQTATSRTSLKNAVIQTQSQRRNMEIAEDVLDLAQKKYKAGVGTNSDVTLAQTELLQAQTNYFSAMLDIVNAEADLKKALGLLK